MNLSLLEKILKIVQVCLTVVEFTIKSFTSAGNPQIEQ